MKRKGAPHKSLKPVDLKEKQEPKEPKETKETKEPKETKFIYFPCPNCSDRSKSQGGWTFYPGGCTEPSCNICNNWKKCIVCYNCNATGKYIVDGDGTERCAKCHLSMTKCKKHKWIESDGGKFTCTICGKSGLATQEFSVQCDPRKHKWKVASSGDIVCSKCEQHANVF